MVIYYLIAAFVLSVVNTGVLLYLYRRQHNPYFSAVFYCIVVANFGFLMLASSSTLDAAMVANKVCYLGSCFAPMFLLFAILRLCNLNFPHAGHVLLAVVNFIVFGLACSAGFSNVYYESVRYTISEGVGSYIPEFGRAHLLWNLLLLGYSAANVFVIVYAFVKEKNVSYKNLFALALLEFLSVASFAIARQMTNDTLLMPGVYVVAQCVLLFISSNVKRYDIPNCVSIALEEENSAAYIAFSSNGVYLGCNEIALSYFPELRSFRVDQRIGDDFPLGQIFCAWHHGQMLGELSSEYHFKYRERNFKATLTHLLKYSLNGVNLYCIEDETQLQRYIEVLGANNNRLKSAVRRHANQILAIQEKMIVGMAQMVESRDSNTGGHIKRTSQVVAILVNDLKHDEELEYSDKFYNALISSAPMHDLGKIAIDDTILRKPGRFDEAEMKAMKTHAEKGATIVENLLSAIEEPYFVEVAKNVACYHHERWDGTGYPYGLSGENIPFEARVMAVADVYDALVSKRCYKEKFSFDEAFDIIMSSMGTHFDPGLERSFVNCRNQLEDYYQRVAVAS